MGEANEVYRRAETRIGSTLVGKWRIERLLGVGGMGAVYEGRHRNQSRVAIKILHRRSATPKADLARFRREGYAANRVGHPGVVGVFDDDVDEDGFPFLVMELLDGQTIDARAQAVGGCLDALEVLNVADTLLDVLDAAHERGVLHRDIKPANLFVTTDGAFKVLDFGVARLEEAEPGSSSTSDGTLIGTPAFSAPEQARGRVADVDARSDIWSVGATMFTLLTGRRVHEAGTSNEQLGLAMTASARSLAVLAPDFPSALVQLVDRALMYEKADRWRSAREMQEVVRWVQKNWRDLGPGSGYPAEWKSEQRADENDAPTCDVRPRSDARRTVSSALFGVRWAGSRWAVAALIAGVALAVSTVGASSLRRAADGRSVAKATNRMSSQAAFARSVPSRPPPLVEPGTIARIAEPLASEAVKPIVAKHFGIGSPRRLALMPSATKAEPELESVLDRRQ